MQAFLIIILITFQDNISYSNKQESKNSFPTKGACSFLENDIKNSLHVSFLIRYSPKTWAKTTRHRQEPLRQTHRKTILDLQNSSACMERSTRNLAISSVSCLKRRKQLPGSNFSFAAAGTALQVATAVSWLISQNAEEVSPTRAGPHVNFLPHQEQNLFLLDRHRANHIFCLIFHRSQQMAFA